MIVEYALVPAMQGVVCRVAGGRERILAVMGGRVAVAIHRQGITATRELVQCMVDNAGQRFVYIAVVGRVNVLAIAAGYSQLELIRVIRALWLSLGRLRVKGFGDRFQEQAERIDLRVSRQQGSEHFWQMGGVF